MKNKSTLIIVVALVLIGAIAFIAYMMMGDTAQDQDQAAANGKDWALRCDANRPDNIPPCDMLQIVVDPQTQKPAMIFSLAHLGAEGLVGVQVSVSGGVLIAAGARVELDGKQVLDGLRFTRCEIDGCALEGVFKEEAFAPFLTGTQGAVAVKTETNQLKVSPLTVKDFPNTFAAMKQRNAAWFADQKKQAEAAAQADK